MEFGDSVRFGLTEISWLSLTMGSRNERRGDLSLPAVCIIAEQFWFLSSADFSSFVNSMLCSVTQWFRNDDEKPKDNLQRKHIRIGFTGTDETSSSGLFFEESSEPRINKNNNYKS